VGGQGVLALVNRVVLLLSFFLFISSFLHFFPSDRHTRCFMFGGWWEGDYSRRGGVYVELIIGFWSGYYCLSFSHSGSPVQY